MTLHRSGILFVARNVAGGVALGAQTHEASVERTPQTIFDDGIRQFGVAIAKTTACTHGQVRRIGHRLHAGSHHDVGFATGHHLVGQINGVQSRQAHLVDVHTRDVHRNARFDCGLSRWHLALPGHQDLPDNHVVHFVGMHVGPLQGFGNSETPEVSSTEIG